MVSIFRRKNNKPAGDFSALSADMHSHLIPGIDDGAPDIGTSLRLIRGMIDLGYKKIITTPHIYADLYPNTPATIAEGYKTMIAELEHEKVPVELHSAAEYLMDEHFTLSLESGERLLTFRDNWILVELSFVVPAINLKEMLFNLQINGYQPVLAHPERYLYFGANKAWYDQIRDTGCLFQLNLLSFAGYYGRGPQDLAEFLIRKKYVDLLGTDLHHDRHLEALRTSGQIFAMVSRLLDTGLIRNASL